jgi:hypothetical protein
MEASDLRPVGRGGDRERHQAAVQTDPAAVVVIVARSVAAMGVQIRGLDVEAYIPAVPMPAAGGE